MGLTSGRGKRGERRKEWVWKVLNEATRKCQSNLWGVLEGDCMLGGVPHWAEVPHFYYFHVLNHCLGAAWGMWPWVNAAVYSVGEGCHPATLLWGDFLWGMFEWCMLMAIQNLISQFDEITLITNSKWSQTSAFSKYEPLY